MENSGEYLDYDLCKIKESIGDYEIRYRDYKFEPIQVPSHSPPEAQVIPMNSRTRTPPKSQTQTQTKQPASVLSFSSLAQELGEPEMDDQGCCGQDNNDNPWIYACQVSCCILFVLLFVALFFIWVFIGP